jgi:hypothetical protein
LEGLKKTTKKPVNVAAEQRLELGAFWSTKYYGA